MENKKYAKTLGGLLKQDYEKFIQGLKDNIKNKQFQTILNLGRKDDLPNDEKILVEEVYIPCNQLFPTQSQIGLSDCIGQSIKFGPERVSKLLMGDASDFENRRILTANKKFIIDGHHRWGEVYMFSPSAEMPCVNITLPGYSENELLKIVQLAIATTYGGISLKEADSKTDVFSMNEEQIKNYISSILVDENLIDICKSIWKFKTKDEVVKKFTQNVLSLKERQPSQAPERKFMPQPKESAKSSGSNKLSDYKGLPSEFINKMKSGKLNFKEPFLREKWIMTFERFKNKNP